MRIENNQTYVAKSINTENKKKSVKMPSNNEFKVSEKALEEVSKNLEEIKKAQDEIELNSQEMKNENSKIKITLTCLEISRRIISGDSVPYNDHKFLLKHDPHLYGRSMKMRIPKSKPFKYRQLSVEEKNQNNIERTENKDSVENKKTDNVEKVSKKEIAEKISEIKNKIEDAKEIKKENKIGTNKDEIEANRKKAEDEREKSKIRLVCLKIYRSIMSGDEVSQADKKYLAKNDPDLYAMSISLSTKKANPKKLAQISEKEKYREENVKPSVSGDVQIVNNGVRVDGVAVQEIFGNILDAKF